ncbi:hypothetical protein SteCoe_32985 [Stentor coeruleus]|uniref:Uncharacterized protein n=1 Tax=Stentor coeruleus TaxID=5963 RepID=A0A1R2AXT0_9CILI|nr:hypothetical protein SteCoe_32985 [Stentor coeruleus]
MSVYSGFSTRNQEAQYYRLVENLIILLQSRVLFSLKSNPRTDDSSWVNRFNTIYTNMKNLEYHKYLEPKLSDSVRDLASYFSFDQSIEPIRSEYSVPQFTPRVGSNSIRELNSPKKKNSQKKVNGISERIRNNEKKSSSKLGMSKYYGRIMDNFLSKPQSVSPKKEHKGMISMESQDFWLLDDKIQVIENDFDY